MKIPFYILGLLMRYGPQQGYKIKQLMSEGIADFTKIKQATVYNNLEIQGEYIQNHLKGLIINKEITISNLLPEYRVYCKSIFNHHIYHIEAELKWIKETIEDLS